MDHLLRQDFAASRRGVGLTSKFLVPSVDSLVRAFFIMAASRAASDGLFLGRAKVPAGEGVPFKLLDDVDIDIPCMNRTIKTTENPNGWRTSETNRTSVSLKDAGRQVHAELFPPDVLGVDTAAFLHRLGRGGLPVHLTRESLDVLSEVDVEALRLLEDEADEPHRAHRIRLRLDRLKLLGVDVSQSDVVVSFQT